MATTDGIRKLLLISNSTLHGSGFLDHAEKEIQDFVGRRSKVLFVPYAMYDRGGYSMKVRERLHRMGLSVAPIHDLSNMPRAVEEAEVIFIGGGNTFRLLKALHDNSLVRPIQRRVESGTPYIGSSAGSIVACPTLKTTKDMPVVQPTSFEALGLVQFQISPHYLDPDPASTHMGETQEQRIMQFLEENEEAVVGLREGSILRVEGAEVILKGPNRVRIFRRGEEPVEAAAGSDLGPLLEKTPAHLGRAA
jgi:dipeptidase E